MFVSPKNYQDADKYFRNCYIKVKEYGDTLVLIEKITPEALWGEDEYGNKVCVEIDGSTTGQLGYTLDFLLPRRAWFQFGDSAHFLCRIPARQWKKGVCKDNTSIQRLVTGKLFSVGLSFNLLHAYVHKQVYHVPQELPGKESIALSPRFALSSDGTIYLDAVAIGKYYPNQNTALVRKLFLQDVKPLFNGVKVTST